MKGQSDAIARRRRDRRARPRARARRDQRRRSSSCTRVPDIVVTLAMSFVWAGFALLVLHSPGGGAARWLKELVVGPLGNEWVPEAARRPARHRRGHLDPAPPVERSACRMYAIGSNRLAAFRSGVPGRPDEDPRLRADRPVRGARRPGADREHRDRVAGPRPVHAARASRRSCSAASASPAAAAASSGRSSAVVVLAADPDRHDASSASTRTSHRRPGRDPDRRGHGRQRHRDAAERGDDRGRRPPSAAPWLTAAAWRRLFRDRPLIPLTVLLVLLVVVLELASTRASSARPGSASPSGPPCRWRSSPAARP